MLRLIPYLTQRRINLNNTQNISLGSTQDTVTAALAWVEKSMADYKDYTVTGLSIHASKQVGQPADDKPLTWTAMMTLTNTVK